MYIVFALVFLVIGGIEATLIMRLQLAVADTSRRLGPYVQCPVHHARDHDGLPGRHADPVRVRQLPGAP